MAAPAVMTAADICGSIAGNVVSNCGFETGDFTDWTLTGNLEGGPQGNYYGVNSGFQNSGNNSAYLGVQGGGGSNIGSLGPFLDLSQAIPVAGNEAYRFTFYLEDFTAPTPGYQQYFAAYVNGVQLNALQNPTDPALIGSYEAFSYILKPVRSAKGTAELSFLFQNDDSFWFLDDVSAAPVGTTPEPASVGLVAVALAALYLLLSRRRNA
jgi:hypothetical protein